MTNIDFQNGFALGMVAVGKAGSGLIIPTAISGAGGFLIVLNVQTYDLYETVLTQVNILL